jgi:hypothetical protein
MDDALKVRFNRASIQVHAVSSIEARIQRAGLLWNVTWGEAECSPRSFLQDKALKVRFNQPLSRVHAVSSATFRFAPGFHESRLRRSKNAGMRYEAVDSDVGDVCVGIQIGSS